VKRVQWVWPILAPAMVMWQVSGENPLVFCYLISWGSITGLRSRASAPNSSSVRHEVSCSNRSGTCST
jgi:hypothetical protein